MKLLPLVSAAALVAGVSLLFTACAVNVDKSDKDDVAAETNAAALTDFKDLGEIPGTGEARTAKYANPPRYAAYTFYADKGDLIDVWVKGVKGSDDDAVAWVIDSKDKTLGFNDDATSTDRNAHVTATANGGIKSKFKIVFRDYYLAKGTFTVTLKVTKPAVCEYGGKTYNVGDSFKSTDGCNDCFCGETGSVGCTKRACVPKCDPASEPNNHYVGTSKEQCMVIRYACPTGTTGFANDCGCGCSQPSDCPEFINCMPGPGGTGSCATLRAKCPYTPVAF